MIPTQSTIVYLQKPADLKQQMESAFCCVGKHSDRPCAHAAMRPCGHAPPQPTPTLFSHCSYNCDLVSALQIKCTGSQ